MPEPQLLTAEQVDLQALDGFLRRVYSQQKSDFLKEHGDWWHRSNANRLVIQVGDKIAGYCAVIPVQVYVAGHAHPALWWVDLVVAPEFRGLGLQTLFDRRVREMSSLLLGFPNKLAGIIHRKHGWGVREDAQVLLLPLRPSQVKMVRRVDGWPGLLVRTAALTLDPLAALWGMWLSSQKSERVSRMETFDGGMLSDVFTRAYSQGLSTTWRDAAYFAWRYDAAPHPEEYTYYLAGNKDSPSHYLIARHLTQVDGLRYTRILDLFGDFEDEVSIRQLLLLAIQDAITHGSGQVTLVASLSSLKRIARKMGFLFAAPFGFCWWSSSTDLKDAFENNNYWTLSDSDNDAPE